MLDRVDSRRLVPVVSRWGIQLLVDEPAMALPETGGAQRSSIDPALCYGSRDQWAEHKASGDAEFLARSFPFRGSTSSATLLLT